MAALTSSLILAALLTGVNAQESAASVASTVAAAGTTAAAVTTTAAAAAATLSLSINSNLPQTAPTGPSGFVIP